MEKAQSTIQLRIDSKTKRQAKKTLNEVGLDVSSAVKLFLRNVVIHQAIPFEIRTKNGFTPAQESQMLEEAKEAVKENRGFRTAEALHRNILSRS